MLTRKGPTVPKTILQLTEEEIRKSGNHGDKLMSILREGEEHIKDNVMFIRTILRFEHPSPEITVFNEYMRMLRFKENCIAVQIILE